MTIVVTDDTNPGIFKVQTMGISHLVLPFLLVWYILLIWNQ